MARASWSSHLDDLVIDPGVSADEAGPDALDGVGPRRSTAEHGGGGRVHCHDLYVGLRDLGYSPLR